MLDDTDCSLIFVLKTLMLVMNRYRNPLMLDLSIRNIGNTKSKLPVIMAIQIMGLSGDVTDILNGFTIVFRSNALTQNTSLPFHPNKRKTVVKNWKVTWSKPLRILSSRPPNLFMFSSTVITTFSITFSGTETKLFWPS